MANYEPNHPTPYHHTMRKQYHFRKSDKGLLAWDIHRLIILSKDITPSAVPLADIREIDETYWYDLEGDTPTCRSIMQHMRLVEETDLAYPIILCPAGRIMDGMHRVVKALLAGKSHIMAVQLAVMPEPDYIGIAPDALPYD